jgi:flagellar basal-body rod modification protein FlgD
MTVTSTNSATSAATATGSASKKGGLGALDQGDFLKLMTVQMQHQDPFDPVDQKEMLAQMAQFSSLAGTAEMGDTLKQIAMKLDALAASQTAFLNAAATLSNSTPASTQE